MLMYIVSTNQVVNNALIIKCTEEGKTHGVQRPVYYIGEVLSPATLPTLPEDSLRRLYDIQKATTLLRAAPDHGGGISTTRQHPQQTRYHMPRVAMGHHLRA
jgi:hypothetical protein